MEMNTEKRKEEGEPSGTEGWRVISAQVAEAKAILGLNKLSKMSAVFTK